MTIKQTLPKTVFFRGGKRAVILMHAYTGTPNDVRSLGRYLNNQGYTVLMPLFEGHGTTRPEDILEAGPSIWKKQLNDYLQEFQANGYNEVAVFGLSLGGLFAMSAVTDSTEQIIGGGEFCSPITPENETNIFPTFLYYAKTVMKKAGCGEAEINRRLMDIEKLLPKQLGEIKEFSSKVFNQLPYVTQPTLLVQAAKDKMINPNDVYEVEKQLKASPSVVKWYPESGHVITVGPEKKQLQEDVLSFINNLNWCQPN